MKGRQHTRQVLLAYLALLTSRIRELGQTVMNNSLECFLAAALFSFHHDPGKALTLLPFACSTEALLRKMTGLCEQHSTLLAQLLDIETAVGREEQHLRCTRVAADVIEAGELQATCYELQALSGRLLALGDSLDDCLRRSSRLGPHFVAGHWEHMDARLSCAANRLAQLQEACAALLGAVSAELKGPSKGDLEGLKRRDAPAEAPRAAAVVAPGRLWRLLRASLPYQLALLVLFGCFYFLFADDCPLSSKLLLSPQLRYAFGSPY